MTAGHTSTLKLTEKYKPIITVGYVDPLDKQKQNQNTDSVLEVKARGSVWLRRARAAPRRRCRAMVSVLK